MTRKLLPLVGITDDYTRDVFLSTSYIRNSLHNNGIHRGKNNLSLNMQGMDFAFVTGKRMECASWQHILAAVYETIEAIDRILATAKVTAIPPPFQDDYARDPADD